MHSRRDFLAKTTAAWAALGWGGIAKASGIRPTKASYRVCVGQGRHLGVVEFGDPLGFPVFYFHGLPACRFEAAVLRDHATAAHCRLIAVDRPGIGLSSPQPGRSILDWTDDVNRLVDSLLDKEGGAPRPFSLLAFSSGAPYAIACAYRLQETGLRRVAIVSGVKSPEFPHLPEGNGGRMLRLAKNRPRLARTLISAFARRSQRRPSATIHLLTKDMARADQHLLLSNIYHDAFLQTVHESTRQGPCGILEDAQLLTSCWNIPLHEIALPVSIWHGACDKTIPAAASHELAKHLPGSRLTIVAHEGHVSTLHQSGDEILRWLGTESTSVAGTHHREML